MLKFAVIVLFHNLYLHQSESKILRIGNHYVGRFVLVDSDSRIKSHCIRNITKNTTPQECSYECIKDKNCLSINRHRELGICELLATSKFNESGNLQRDPNWVHYETDDDERNVGKLCTDLLPCQRHEVCEMTFECDPAFKCRCRDGFSGNKCKTYNGPGTDRKQPAASCHLLMLKYKSVPDGNYWFKGLEKMTKCERRVNGGYSKWSSFGRCEENEKQERIRSCTNPKPKGGGTSCDKHGPEKEVRKCVPGFNELFFTFGHALKRNTLVGTIKKWRREGYKISFEIKMSVNKLPTQYTNLLHFTIGENDVTPGSRIPGVFFKGKGKDAVKIVINAEVNHRIDLDRPKSFFKDWRKFKFLQYKENDSFILKVYLAGELIAEKKDPYQPKVYSNVKIYVSDDFYPTTEGLIRNLSIEGIGTSVITREAGF